MKRTTKLTIYGWFWEIVWLIKNPKEASKNNLNN
jgi:hypothetical protein